jgi:hypothetical protein
LRSPVALASITALSYKRTHILRIYSAHTVPLRLKHFSTAFPRHPPLSSIITPSPHSKTLRLFA